MFYIGLIVGLFIGANVGLIVSRLLTSAKLEEEMTSLSWNAPKTFTNSVVPQK